MAHYIEWLPGARAEILAMCQSWLTYLTEERRTAWGIPLTEYTALSTLYLTARSLLTKAMDEDIRTHVITVQCQEAFKNLTAKMRFFKDRYFKIPPLTLGDLAALGLHPRTPSSPIPRPEAQAEADLTFPGIHLVELRDIRPVGGPPPDSRSDYGTRIYYGFSGPPTENFKFRVAEPPKTGKDLPYSIFTRRRKERFDFDGESGNTVYFCLRYENPKGREEGQGPFGPIFQAVIP
jgi:hypothetical protein